jgi:hypothetical protein
MGNHYCSCLLNNEISNPTTVKNEEIIYQTELFLQKSSYTALSISRFPFPENMENRLKDLPSFLPLPKDTTIYKTPNEDYIQSSWENLSELPLGVSRFYSPRMNIYFEGHLVPCSKKTELANISLESKKIKNTMENQLEQKKINGSEKLISNSSEKTLKDSPNLTNQKSNLNETNFCSRNSVEGFGLIGVAPEGRGRLLTSELNLYEGEFKNDFFNFEGYMKNDEGLTLKGTFKNLKLNGVGEERWENGTSYFGNFDDGFKKGKGKLIWENENKAKEEKYEGEFENDCFEGYGIYCWGYQKKYTGQWKNGKMHGEGVFTWKDGRVYKGSFESDKKNGKGTLTWSDGRVWNGLWKDDKQHGIGELIDAGGKKQVGVWEDGKRVRWLEEQELQEYWKKEK